MCLLYIYICGKWQNFIQLSLNLTKICHIKRNHTVNCYFSLKFELFNSFTYVAPVLSQHQCSILRRKAPTDARWRLQTVDSLWIHIPARRRCSTHGLSDCLRANCTDFIAKDEWPLHSPDLSSLDYRVWVWCSGLGMFTKFTQSLGPFQS